MQLPQNQPCVIGIWAWSSVTRIRFVDGASVAIASYVGCIWCFIICFRVSFQCNVLFFVSLLSLFFLCPPNSILSRTGKKENQDASNLTVPMTMCLFPVPFPLTPSLRPQVSSINPTVTRSLLYSVLRDAPSERGLQSRDAHLSDYPSLDYQGLYVTLVTLLDLVPLLQHGQHGEHLIRNFGNVHVCLWMLETVVVKRINCLKSLCVARAFLTVKLNYGVSHSNIFHCFMARGMLSKWACVGGGMGQRKEGDCSRNLSLLPWFAYHGDSCWNDLWAET